MGTGLADAVILAPAPARRKSGAFGASAVRPSEAVDLAMAGLAAAGPAAIAALGTELATEAIKRRYASLSRGSRNARRRLLSSGAAQAAARMNWISMTAEHFSLQ